jgi:hypothetical protein
MDSSTVLLLNSLLSKSVWTVKTDRGSTANSMHPGMRVQENSVPPKHNFNNFTEEKSS